MKNLTLCKAVLVKGYEQQYPFSNGEVFVFLGEISNMEGHCVILRTSDNKIFSCYHTDDFVELTKEEV
jgi:hypothetical protein